MILVKKKKTTKKIFSLNYIFWLLGYPASDFNVVVVSFLDLQPVSRMY